MMVKNKTNKNYKRSQKGRSMVEMLGVLAIVGVLSVGGVYGYGVAMKKHKANETLHKASMLATTVSAYAMSNDGNLPSSIADFANLGYDTELTDNGTQFKLTMKGVGYDVCKQMQSSKGGIAQGVECDETTGNATITYYKNLATTEEEGKKSPTGSNSTSSFNPNGATKDDDGAVCSGDRPGECSVCLKNHIGETSGEWFDSDALCTSEGQICLFGNCIKTASDIPTFTGNFCKCDTDANGEYYCGGDGEASNYAYCPNSDSWCSQYGKWDENSQKCVVETFCTNNTDCTSDEYCHYSGVVYGNCQPTKKGTCVVKANSKGSFKAGTTAESEGFIRSSVGMDWYSAKNFCRSYGKNLVTISQIVLGNAVPGDCYGSGAYACQISADEWSRIRLKFGDDSIYWTVTLSPNWACHVLHPDLKKGVPTVSYAPIDTTNAFYALCR